MKRFSARYGDRIKNTVLGHNVMVQLRELAIMLGGGVSLGLAVVAFGVPTAPAPAASGGAGPQGHYTPELLAAREQYLASHAHDEEQGVLPANQGSAVALAETNRIRMQQIANAILSKPNLTMRELQVATQILNGQVSPGGNYDQGYATLPYPATPIQGSSQNSSSLARRFGGEVYGSAAASSRNEASRYRGLSGTSYQYDLSDPGQRLRYETDPMAQLRDSVSVDPRRGLDASIGQYGGGIER